MYCRKCGKEIDYDAPVCKECEQVEQFFDAPNVAASAAEEQVPVAPQTGRMEGFGKALTSTILGTVAIVFSIVAFAVALFDIIAGFLLGVIAVGSIVPVIIFGIKSIKTFVNAKRSGSPKPIATLVCGIVGLASAGLAVIFVWLTMILIALI